MKVTFTLQLFYIKGPIIFVLISLKSPFLLKGLFSLGFNLSFTLSFLW
jgi:hypothetical protein